jgi:hypothetical protein
VSSAHSSWPARSPAPGAAHAAATLTGASPLRVLQKVDYQAHGLTPTGSYSMRIRRNVTHNGRTYRCAAYLSAPRRAAGTEQVRSLLLGNCSHHVAQHALSPVLIVPSPEIGDARRAVAQANGRARH